MQSKIFIHYFDKKSDPALVVETNDLKALESFCSKYIERAGVTQVDAFDMRMERLLVSISKSGKQKTDAKKK
jgi:hypothetical protein